MRRLGHLGMLVGGALLLVGLYLAWMRSGGAFTLLGGLGGPIVDVQDHLTGTSQIDGWIGAVSWAAALADLAVIGAAVSAFAGGRWAARLPLVPAALPAVYFTLAVAAEVRRAARQEAGAGLHLAAGAYVTAAGLLLVVGGLIAAHRDRLWRRPTTTVLVTSACVVGELVALLLPWHRSGFQRLESLGVDQATGVVAALLALAGLVGVARRPAALAGAVFVAGGLTSVPYGSSNVYGAYAALGCALAACGIVLLDRSPVRLALPGREILVVAIPAAFLLASMFMPWARLCGAFTDPSGPSRDRCLSLEGWTATSSTAAVFLAVAVVVGLAAGYVRAERLVLPIAALLATAGFEFTPGHEEGIRLGVPYGAYLGYAAGAVFVVALATRRSRRAWDLRLRWELVPAGLALVYGALVVVPWWDVLPIDLQLRVIVAPLSWVSIASLVVVVELAFCWSAQRPATEQAGRRRTLLPVALLALVAVDLARHPWRRNPHLTWDAGLLGAILIGLVVVGHVDDEGGPANVRIPEILRIDRI